MSRSGCLFCVFVCAVALPWGGVQAQVQPLRQPIVLSGAQEARYMALLPGLRCMQCQNESLASSQAPLAKDMRYKIRQLITGGQSDAQIKQYLVDRYGQYVLYKPRFEPLTWLLWLGPFLLLAIALAVAWRVARRSSTMKTREQQPDATALNHLLDEEP